MLTQPHIHRDPGSAVRRVRECLRQRTGGETSLLVTLGELDVEVGDQSMDVVVPLDLQAERWGKREVLSLHRVDVHFLLE